MTRVEAYTRVEQICTDICRVFRSHRTPTKEQTDALLLALRDRAMAEAEWGDARAEEEVRK